MKPGHPAGLHAVGRLLSTRPAGGVKVDLKGVLSNPPESLKDLLDGPNPESHEP